MKNNPIHVVLPQSFIDEHYVNPVDLAERLSVVYDNKSVSFQVDIVPDDFFDTSVTWLS